MDKRQEKTRKAIFTSFNNLLAKKRYDKITINDILLEAQISRSTFYDHFNSKDDLLKAMNESIFHHVFSEHLTAESSHNFSGIPTDLSTFITHTLYHLRDESENLKGVLSCDSSHLFWQYLQNEVGSVIRQHFILESDYKDAIPYPLFISHLSMTFIELVKFWFLDGHKESPEKITEYFKLLVFGNILE